ncbi:MAG TPA: hypothetical protein VLE70_13010 [Anaerolineae bacterium]|jgi:hypothetical protein|nr:hypothetical protein [Anaerolineae bacterium]
MSTARQTAKVSAYLLRCWAEGSKWRYSLEEVSTGKRHGFATLDEFVSFLLVMAVQPEKMKAGHEKNMAAKSSTGDK